jgi:hypothetical protein
LVANLWQCLGECGNASEFVFVAYLAPSVMIAILLSPAGIATSRLDVTVWGGTNPDISPCRRNSQAFDSDQTLFIANSFSCRI